MGCALSEPEKVLLPEGTYDHIKNGVTIGQFILKQDEELMSARPSGGGPMWFYNVKFINKDGSPGENVPGVEDGLWKVWLGPFGEFQVEKTRVH